MMKVCDICGNTHGKIYSIDRTIVMENCNFIDSGDLKIRQTGRCQVCTKCRNKFHLATR